MQKTYVPIKRYAWFKTPTVACEQQLHPLQVCRVLLSCSKMLLEASHKTETQSSLRYCMSKGSCMHLFFFFCQFSVKAVWSSAHVIGHHSVPLSCVCSKVDSNCTTNNECKWKNWTFCCPGARPSVASWRQIRPRRFIETLKQHKTSHMNPWPSSFGPVMDFKDSQRKQKETIPDPTLLIIQIQWCVPCVFSQDEGSVSLLVRRSFQGCPA